MALRIRWSLDVASTSTGASVPNPSARGPLLRDVLAWVAGFGVGFFLSFMASVKTRTRHAGAPTCARARLAFPNIAIASQDLPLGEKRAREWCSTNRARNADVARDDLAVALEQASAASRPRQRGLVGLAASASRPRQRGLARQRECATRPRQRGLARQRECATRPRQRGLVTPVGWPRQRESATPAWVGHTSVRPSASWPCQRVGRQRESATPGVGRPA